MVFTRTLHIYYLCLWLLPGSGCASASLSSETGLGSQSHSQSGGIDGSFADNDAKGAFADILQPDAVFAAAKKTAVLLENLLQNDGRFIYRFDLNPTRTPVEKYNILRHSGSLYALSQWHEIEPSGALRAHILQGIIFLRRCCFYPIGLDENSQKMRIAVSSYTGRKDNETRMIAKLGGTGLALLAIVSARSVGDDMEVSILELQSLGRFVLMMQQSDGRFFSKFRLDTMNFDGEWHSLYYPGEAALGLIRLFEVDGDETWLHAANRGLRYLAETRRGKEDVPHDHWAMIATEELLRQRTLLSDEDVKIHLQHMRQLAEAILSCQQDGSVNPVLDGAFDSLGKTAPAATRIEGLVAAYRVLRMLGAPDDEKRIILIFNAIQRGVAFLVRAQIFEGTHAGAIPRSLLTMDGDAAEAEQFNRRTSEVRIDYLQHALSAMVGYLHITSFSK